MARDPTHAEVEIEQSVLGLLLEGAETAWLVLDRISPQDMLEPVHERIVEAVRRIVDAGKEPSPLTVAGAMASDRALNVLGGADYLRKIIGRFGRNRDIAPELCDALVDHAMKRALAHEIAETETRLSDGSLKGLDIAAEHQAAVLAVLEGRPSPDDPVSWYEAGRAVVESLGAQSHTKRVLQPYGIAEIDNEIGGMAAGNLIIVGGRPGMGKTALALTIAHAAARPKEQIVLDLDPGAPPPSVGVFLSSLEMERDELLERGLSMAAYRRRIEIPYNQIRLRKLTEDQTDLLADILIENRALPIDIDDRPDVTLGQIGVRLRRAQAKFARAGQRLGLGIIDHLGLIEPDGRYHGNKVAELTATTRGLKALAKALKIPLIVLCQLSRGVDSRDDKRPYLSDLRDSGSIEQDADVVLLIHRPEYYLRKSKPDDSAPQKERDAWHAAMDREKNRLVVDIAKNRQGPEATVRLTCHLAYNWIGEQS
jgi:replicative DNA helicase